jgi:hypothetical protein
LAGALERAQVAAMIFLLGELVARSYYLHGDRPAIVVVATEQDPVGVN